MIDGNYRSSHIDHDNVGPAASVHSTSHDLAQYLLMFLNHGSFETVAFISESIDFLHKPHMLYTQSQEETIIHPRMRSTFPTFGLGWRVQDYCGMKKRPFRRRGRYARTHGDAAGKQRRVVLTNSEDRRTYYSTLYTALDMLVDSNQLTGLKHGKRSESNK